MDGTNLEAQCKLICEYCAKDIPLDSFIYEGGSFFHKQIIESPYKNLTLTLSVGIDTIYRGICKASELRKLYEYY